MITLEQRRTQASNICIDIFNDYCEEELSTMPGTIARAWQIGKEITELLENK